MSTTTPTRESILENIRTTLTDVSPATYRTRPNLVSRRYKHYADLADSDLPAIFIIDNGGNITQATSNSILEEMMSVIIVGVVKWNANSINSDIASTQANNLIADIIEALNVDIQRGTNSSGEANAINTTVSNIDTVQGEIEPYAFFTLNVNVEINYQSTNTGRTFHS